MIFDFLSAVFLGGALFKDAYDKTASDRHFKHNEDMKRAEEERKAAILKQQIDERNKIIKENVLQFAFMKLYLEWEMYFIDPTGDLNFELLNPNKRRHIVDIGFRLNDPNVKHFSEYTFDDDDGKDLLDFSHYDSDFTKLRFENDHQKVRNKGLCLTKEGELIKCMRDFMRTGNRWNYDFVDGIFPDLTKELLHWNSSHTIIINIERPGITEYYDGKVVKEWIEKN